ncbi:hypothetical protein [Micromonospora sp. U21]|uniref:hypothetical protein n=1 Tax=Micromonospora sp. U21 TaxID=2824899 RepID=UPI001B36454B|nr:hypothetical protein [Micromonospora sp. U21]MBQ0903143.1 hypothetical protein [Micromonospora sp. U21]
MPMLNPPDILPEAMRYLVRAVMAHRGARCPKSELLELVAPGGLAEAMKPLDSDRDADPDIDNTGTSGRLIADRSLSALAALGFVELAGTDVAATETVLGRWRTAREVTAASFSRLLRSRIWHIAATDIGSDADARVRDLVDALAVLFAARQPLRPIEFEAGPGRRFAEAQTQWFGPKKSDWPVTNSTQFLPFCRWAPYLGLAQPISGRSLVADASRAMLEDLIDLPHGRIRAAEFIAHCGKKLPISDDGPRSLWKADDGQEFSPGLSMSLHQLEVAGHLTLPTAESDTDTLVVTLGVPGESTRISHIDWHPRISGKERP